MAWPSLAETDDGGRLWAGRREYKISKSRQTIHVKEVIMFWKILGMAIVCALCVTNSWGWVNPDGHYLTCIQEDPKVWVSADGRAYIRTKQNTADFYYHYHFNLPNNPPAGTTVEQYHRNLANSFAATIPRANEFGICPDGTYQQALCNPVHTCDTRSPCFDEIRCLSSGGGQAPYCPPGSTLPEFSVRSLDEREALIAQAIKQLVDMAEKRNLGGPLVEEYALLVLEYFPNGDQMVLFMRDLAREDPGYVIQIWNQAKRSLVGDSHG